MSRFARLHVLGKKRGYDTDGLRQLARDNFEVSGLSDLTDDQLAVLERGLGSNPEKPARRKPPARVVPFPENPPAPPRVKKEKPVSLAKERRDREPASEAQMNGIFSFGYRQLGWHAADIRKLITRLTGKDIRNQNRAPDRLTVHDVDRVMGSLRTLLRHHKNKATDSAAAESNA